MYGAGKQFTRRVENFVCEHCGVSVVGNGYTNHCPECFWSKHVDIFPGDRGAACQGAMAPVGVEQEAGHFIVLQRCVICGHARKNRVGVEENITALVEIMQSLAREQSHGK